MKVAIITDSTAYIPEDVRKLYDIYMVPLIVNLGDTSYEEECELTAEKFYPMVREEKTFPKTSQPSIGKMVDLLESLKGEYDAAIAIHLSSGISGTIQSMQSAIKMVEGFETHVFDSEISCMVQGFYVLEAAKLAKENKDPESILNRLKEMKTSMRAYFMVDDLTHLHRGGRLNGAQALLGSMLQVKPILHFVDTKIVPFEKIRTQKKALNRLMDLFAEDAADGTKIRATVIHANVPQLAETFIEELKEKYPNVEVSLSYFGAVIGTHLGEGSLGLGWYKI